EHARLTDPVGERRAAEVDALPRIDLRLAVQRQMVAVLRYEHMGQEAGTGKALRDRPARRWRLHDLRAAPARGLRPHMTDHPELTRHVLEHLRDVLAERLQRAAALRARARHLVRDRLSRQVLGKGPTDRRGGRFGRLKIAALQRRELRFARLELLERQLKLRDPRIELLARATEP